MARGLASPVPLLGRSRPTRESARGAPCCRLRRCWWWPRRHWRAGPTSSKWEPLLKNAGISNVAPAFRRQFPDAILLDGADTARRANPTLIESRYLDDVARAIFKGVGGAAPVQVVGGFNVAQAKDLPRARMRPFVISGNLGEPDTRARYDLPHDQIEQFVARFVAEVSNPKQRLLRCRFRRVYLGVTADDAVFFAGHLTLQPPLDDRQRELQQRAVGLLHFERGLPGVDDALLDRPLCVGRARGSGENFSFLSEIEDHVVGVAISAIRTLHRERPFPFTVEGGGGFGRGGFGLGREGRNERHEYDSQCEQFLHCLFVPVLSVLIRGAYPWCDSPRSAARGSRREAPPGVPPSRVFQRSSPLASRRSSVV